VNNSLQPECPFCRLTNSVEALDVILSLSTCCITANVLQTKVDTQCAKLATKLSWQRLQRSTFRVTASYLSKVANYPTCIWCLRWGDPVWVLPRIRDLWHQKTRVPGLSCGVVCMILRLAVAIQHRLVTDGQINATTAYTALAWRYAVKKWDGQHPESRGCAAFREK